MESKPNQTLVQTLLFFWFGFASNHCMSDGSLYDVPVSVLGQRVNKTAPCIQELFTYIEGETKKQCGRLIYPKVKTIIRNQSVCFTDSAQDAFFDGGIARRVNLTGCQILQQQQEITNISNLSCIQLRRGFQKLRHEGPLLLTMVVQCGNKTNCLVIIASRRHLSSYKDLREGSCLSKGGIIPFRENVQSTTPASSEISSKGDGFLDYLKEYMIPIFATLVGVLFLVLVVFVIRFRKQNKNTRNTTNRSRGIVDSLQPTTSSLENDDDVYHEPIFQTYVNVENTPAGNYEYAYGHLDPARRSYTTGAQDPGEKHDYVNITELPDKRQGDEQDYVEIDKSSEYTQLDRLSRIDDKTHYQALSEQRDRVRPKLAPKPALRPKPRRQAKPKISYVQVL